MSYIFFWVFPRRQIVAGRRFGTLCQFHLQRLDVDTVYIQPLKMELTQGSEMSANYNLTPGKYPKEYIRHLFIFVHLVWRECRMKGNGIMVTSDYVRNVTLSEYCFADLLGLCSSYDNLFLELMPLWVNTEIHRPTWLLDIPRPTNGTLTFRKEIGNITY